MKIVIAGGSGQVGTILARHFHKEGNRVLVLSVHAKIVSQIRGDGVVPFGKYLSMFKAEG
jgi:uncharacterized protein YbjT (DUF2867 family)